jgi:hypothetical protein
MTEDEQRAHLLYAMRQVFAQQVAADRGVRERAIAEFNRNGADVPLFETRH